MLFRDVLREPCDIRWCQFSFRWRFYNALPSRKATVGILSDDWEISQREDVIYDLSVTIKDRHEILVYPKPDSKLGKIHFNVHNNNVFYKHELRDWLEERYPGASGNFLHGSDNDLESIAYLLAVYGKDQMDAARERLLAAIGN